MFWTAFMMGLIGNFHCAGMCGPIAIALPIDQHTWAKRLLGSLLYNLGRTVTYAFLGAFFGLVGKGFVMAGFQQGLSIGMGVIMLLIVFFPSLLRNPFGENQRTFRFVGNIKKRLRQLFSVSTYGSLFTIGLLNGLLPCGLVYFAIVGAIAAGGILEGSFYMVLFGLGTLPIMFALPILGQVLTGKVRQHLTKAIPVMMVVVGSLFILRGLGLKIPYVSPPTQILSVEKVEQINAAKMNSEKGGENASAKPEGKCGSCH